MVCWFRAACPRPPRRRVWSPTLLPSHDYRLDFGRPVTGQVDHVTDSRLANRCAALVDGDGRHEEASERIGGGRAASAATAQGMTPHNAMHNSTAACT